MLRKETVNDDLIQAAQSLMLLEDMDSFQLVGGTAISLLLGHRKSIDIDLFSNLKVDLIKLSRSISKRLNASAEFNITDDNINTIINGVRVEIYHNWSIPFRKAPIVEDGLRISALEDLAAFKLSAIIGRREKKDYIDLYFLFKHLKPEDVLRDFKNYEPLLSTKSLMFALSEVDSAIQNKSIMPDMLMDFSWEEIKDSLLKVAREYIKEVNNPLSQQVKTTE